VWVHEGGFTGGTGSSLLYRGDTMARLGDVVVVTVNYRLGALGFLGHRVLGGGSGGGPLGNWGLMDQVAALRWVRDNIGGFGGDPLNVTVFGESAGGMSVAALLAAPSARGLFHRAVIESGPPYTHTVERAERAAADVAGILGIGELRREALERVPVTDLVAATVELQNRPAEVGELPLPFLPVVDGDFLDRPPEVAIADGSAAQVPLLIGTTRDELSMFALGDHRMAKMDDDQLVRWISRASPSLDAAPAIDAYRVARHARGEPVTPKDLWVAMGTDRVFRWPSLRLAAAHGAHQPRTFVYLFTWETPVFGGVLGSCHALEIPFVFGTVRRRSISIFAGGGPGAEALSDQMLPSWTSFARTGDPLHDGIGGWPSWEPHRRTTMVFGPRTSVVDAPRNEELAVWEHELPLTGVPPTVPRAGVPPTL
jgi:para-nitrobenzyl esterase